MKYYITVALAFATISRLASGSPYINRSPVGSATAVANTAKPLALDLLGNVVAFRHDKRTEEEDSSATTTTAAAAATIDAVATHVAVPLSSLVSLVSPASPSSAASSAASAASPASVASPASPPFAATTPEHESSAAPAGIREDELSSIDQPAPDKRSEDPTASRGSEADQEMAKQQAKIDELRRRVKKKQREFEKEANVHHPSGWRDSKRLRRYQHRLKKARGDLWQAESDLEVLKRTYGQTADRSSATEPLNARNVASSEWDQHSGVGETPLQKRSLVVPHDVLHRVVGEHDPSQHDSVASPDTGSDIEPRSIGKGQHRFKWLRSWFWRHEKMREFDAVVIDICGEEKKQTKQCLWSPETRHALKEMRHSIRKQRVDNNIIAHAESSKAGYQPGQKYNTDKRDVADEQDGLADERMVPRSTAQGRHRLEWLRVWFLDHDTSDEFEAIIKAKCGTMDETECKYSRAVRHALKHKKHELKKGWKKNSHDKRSTSDLSEPSFSAHGRNPSIDLSLHERDSEADGSRHLTARTSGKHRLRWHERWFLRHESKTEFDEILEDMCAGKAPDCKYSKAVRHALRRKKWQIKKMERIRNHAKRLSLSSSPDHGPEDNSPEDQEQGQTRDRSLASPNPSSPSLQGLTRRDSPYHIRYWLLLRWCEKNDVGLECEKIIDDMCPMPDGPNTPEVSKQNYKCRKSKKVRKALKAYKKKVKQSEASDKE